MIPHPGSPFWVPSAVLQSHLNRTATGRADCDWLSKVRADLLPRRVPRTLVLGCGNGFLERVLARFDGIGTILATDPDPASVEEARRQARRLGFSTIEYAELDPGREPLPEGAWDLVVAQDLLHHVPDVEALLRALNRALSPTGRFVFSEYTGPRRFQHAEDRMDLVQRYFRVLPERLRLESGTGRILWRRESVDAERLARDLPFEAAESDTLLRSARRAFVPEAELSLGQGLLHPVLSGLAGNFSRAAEKAAEEDRILEVLCAAETHLTASGHLAPLFTAFVGRRRDA